MPITGKCNSIKIKRRRKKRSAQTEPTPRETKTVRIDNRTLIEVSVDISDADAIERYNFRHNLGAKPKIKNHMTAGNEEGPEPVLDEIQSLEPDPDLSEEEDD